MRLKSSLWVNAYIRTCFSHGAHITVVKKGDEDAGQIYIKCNHLDGLFSLYGPKLIMGTEMSIDRMFEEKSEKPVREEIIDSLIDKQCEFDPDIWIIEVESRGGQVFLDTV